MKKLKTTFWKIKNHSSHFFIAILKIHLTVNKCYLLRTKQQGFLFQQKHVNSTIYVIWLRSMIDQTGMCCYKARKVIWQYLKPLTENEFVINSTQDFSSVLNNISISEDEEDVSYDVESLFTNILMKDTIDFICDEIYVHKKSKPICKKYIFKKLLCKHTTECTVVLQENFESK